MIELMDMQLVSLEEVVELRNKILNLFRYLNFSDLQSLRNTVRISDFIHHIARQQDSFGVKIYFEQSNPVKLHFIVHQLTPPFEELLHKYHDLSVVSDPNSVHFCLELSPDFILEKNTVPELKEKIIVESKAELMRQIKQKNTELNHLLEDLKKSSGLIQSEKMRALGVLTAGVAHELNNPMMSILNFVQYCIKKTEPDDKRYEALKDAEHETKRCIDIVSNLLTFSHLEKEGVDLFQPVNVSLLLQRILKILTFRIRNEQIILQENIPDDIPKVLGHENRLQQVFLNIITNAMDAMKSKQTRQLGLNVQVTGNDNLKIKISDTGEGMSEEVKQKIFEPFFTTKPTGLGTGLGLSVCESIIKEHNGSIHCHSEPDKGTEFSITLPLRGMQDDNQSISN